MTTYSYGKSGVSVSVLRYEVLASAISSASLVGVTFSDATFPPNNLHLEFDGDLSGPDEATLDALVAAHAGGSMVTHRVWCGTERMWYEVRLPDYSPAPTECPNHHTDILLSSDAVASLLLDDRSSPTRATLDPGVVLETPGELRVRTFRAASPPTLDSDNLLAVWEDTGDDDRPHIVYRKTGGTGNSVALSVTGMPPRVEDADADTGVEVEHSPDDDTIRFSTGGSERAVIGPDGYIAIGSPTPLQQVTVFGSDESGGPEQTNGIMLCGTDGADKEICWADGVGENDKRWSMYTWRNEGGEFLYIYGFSADRDMVVFDDTGRVGVNKQSNIFDYRPIWVNQSTGALNDLRVFGEFTKSYQIMYDVQITTAGTPDRFKWRKSLDCGVTWSSYSAESDVSTSPVEIENGISFVWGADTGHNTDDRWVFVAFPQLPLGAFTVAPPCFQAVLTTPDITEGTPVWSDITYSVGSNWSQGAAILSAGDKSACYVGMKCKFHGITWCLSVLGIGVTKVVSYWDGDSWVQLTGPDHDYMDGTANFTSLRTAEDTWESGLLTGWSKRKPEGVSDDAYDLYWVRITSSTTVTTPPRAAIVAPGMNNRFAVYSAHYDHTPAMRVTTLGHVETTGEFKMRVVSSNVEPTMQGDNRMCIWEDTASDRTYLLYRRTDGTHVKAEMR